MSTPICLTPVSTFWDLPLPCFHAARPTRLLWKSTSAFCQAMRRLNPKKPKNFPALAFLILCGLFMRHSPTKATWGDPPLPVERKGKKPQECAQDHNPDGPGEESDIAHRIHHPG